MAAYIVGMIAGTVCLIAPLLYAMNVNRCVATILATNPEFDPQKFIAFTPQGLLYPIAIVGAVVLLLSAALMAFTTLGRCRGPRPKAPEAESATPPEEEAPLVP